MRGDTIMNLNRGFFANFYQNKKKVLGLLLRVGLRTDCLTFPPFNPLCFPMIWYSTMRIFPFFSPLRGNNNTSRKNMFPWANLLLYGGDINIALKANCHPVFHCIFCWKKCLPLTIIWKVNRVTKGK